MTGVGWLVVAIAFGFFATLLGVFLGSEQGHLPRNFDFDTYKTRELNQRGLFDKTKWR